MKSLMLAALALVVAGCVSSPPREYPVTQHLDIAAMQSASALPPPFDTYPESDESDVLIQVSHVRGALPLDFNVHIHNETVSYDVWAPGRIEEGVSIVFGEPNDELVAKASRVAITRVPKGTYTIVAQALDDDEDDKRETIELKGGRRQIWVVMFTPVGTFIGQVALR
jgi:hypothetical protein